MPKGPQSGGGGGRLHTTHQGTVAGGPSEVPKTIEHLAGFRDSNWTLCRSNQTSTHRETHVFILHRNAGRPGPLWMFGAARPLPVLAPRGDVVFAGAPERSRPWGLAGLLVPE